MLSTYITSQLPLATGTMLDSAGLQAEEAQALHQTTVQTLETVNVYEWQKDLKPTVKKNRLQCNWQINLATAVTYNTCR